MEVFGFLGSLVGFTIVIALIVLQIMLIVAIFRTANATEKTAIEARRAASNAEINAETLARIERLLDAGLKRIADATEATANKIK